MTAGGIKAFVLGRASCLNQKPTRRVQKSWDDNDQVKEVRIGLITKVNECGGNLCSKICCESVVLVLFSVPIFHERFDGFYLR